MVSGKRSSDGRYVTGVVTEIDGTTLIVDGIDVVATRRSVFQVEVQDVLTSISGSMRRG